MAKVTCANCEGRKTVTRQGERMTCGSCNGRGWVNR